MYKVYHQDIPRVFENYYTENRNVHDSYQKVYLLSLFVLTTRELVIFNLDGCQK